VIIDDMRSRVVAAVNAAASGCAFDFDFDLTLAQRALSAGTAPAPLMSARSAWR
jgi:hypothetical protein